MSIRSTVVVTVFLLALAAAASAQAPDSGRVAAPPAPGRDRVAARAQASTRLSTARRTVITTAAQRVSPAVVTVSVEATRMVRVDPFAGFFRDPFFDQFMGGRDVPQRISGLGSGVVITADGLVLTNEHVVRDAQKVTVTLPDNRSFPAEVLGASAAYDLAVLRLKGGTRLPVAPLGGSDDLVVGEWAIAIGNPFGNLIDNPQPTVTAGVISATDRDIKTGTTDTGVYKHMIQTDAAINPGNSGGALANADGEVIGINTFILSQTGGSIGLGFAIPIGVGRRVVDEVTRFGRVRMAWPGMQVQVVDEALAGQLGWSAPGGMVVTRVNAGGPAAKAGLRVKDRIRRVNGRTVNDVEGMRASVYGRFVGDHLAVELERDGASLKLDLVLAEAPTEAP
jgi:serine protease Do